MPRSKPSNFFDVRDNSGFKKSPFVLDLRKYKEKLEDQYDSEAENAYKSRFKKKGLSLRRADKDKIIDRDSLTAEGADIFMDDEINRDKILENFSKFEEYETRLSSTLNRARASDGGNVEETENKFVLKLIPERKNAKAVPFSTFTSKSDTNPFLQNTDANPDNPFSSELRDNVNTGAGFKYNNLYIKGKSRGPEEELFENKSLDKDSPGELRPASGVIKRVGSFALISSVACAIIFGAFYIEGVLGIKEKTVNDSFVAYERFKQAQESLKNLDFKKAAEDFSGAFESIAKAKGSVSEIGDLTLYLAQNVPFDSHADSAISLLNAAKHIALAGENLSFGFSILPLDEILRPEHILNLFTQSASSTIEYSNKVFEEFNEYLTKAEFEITSAESELQNVSVSDFPAEVQENIGELKQKLPLIGNLINIAKDYSRISADLLGKDSEKRYLILFQNSSEIRPTGGFIGSYAIVEFKSGKLVNMFVDGIYNADGRLAVNVVPPKPFEHITTAWSTHDANWFFDFPLSAEKIAWFYEKTGGGIVDGVFSLNVEVVEDLLKITGPLSLEGYDTTLNSENFRDEIQYEVEVAYDKKLNRPKQILADFAPIFIDNLSKAVETRGKEMLALALDNLEKKNIMFYFKDENIQKFFDEQSWTGRIADARCQPLADYQDVPEMPNVKCSESDYLAVVHSNIGGYKTSKFMEERVNYEVEIEEDGSQIANVKIELKHNGGDTKYWWYNRNNIDYVKIYTPNGSELISYVGGIRRDDAEAPDYEILEFSRDEDVSSIESGLTMLGSIDIFNESDKTVFATWLITKPKKSATLEIRYRLPFKIGIENSVTKYDLQIQKQGGSEPHFSVKISTPKPWEVAWNNLDILTNETSFILTKDRVIGYIFKK